MFKINLITKISFSKFGNLLKPEFIKDLNLNAVPEIIELTENKTNELYYYENEVFLERSDGVGLLNILDDDGNIIRFIFDRPVSIFGGVKFCVLPYGSDFIYSIVSTSPRKAYNLDFTLTQNGIYPSIMLGEIYTVLYQEKEKGFYYKGEKHKYWELTYVDKGSLYNVINGTEYRLSQGNLMFFAGDQYHSQYTDSNERASFLTVSFELKFDYPQMLINKVFKVNNEQRDILGKLLKEYNREEPYSADMISSYLIQLTALLIRQLQFEKNSSIDTALSCNIKNKIVSESIFAIERKLFDNFTLKDLADEVCVSPAYLSKIFKKVTGEPLFLYIKKRRFELAKEMIMEGKYSISQISDSLGFCSVQYFSAEFKKEFGLSPVSYAKAIQ